MYYGPATTFEQFECDLEDAAEDRRNLRLGERLSNLRKRQQALMGRLRFNGRARHLVSLAQHVLWQKGWRKDVEYHGFYCYEPLFREVAKRKGEGDWRNLLFLLPWEVEEFILHDRPDLGALRERRRFSCFVVDRDKTRMLVGSRARGFYKKLGVEKDLSHLTEARGQCAYAGKACGRVKLIHVPGDMEKMVEGDIIVSQATSPDLILAMKKAAAIVTNTGGLICHAAITARELRIPCVVGTRNATLIFRDGDLVEVDATEGLIKKVSTLTGS